MIVCSARSSVEAWADAVLEMINPPGRGAVHTTVSFPCDVTVGSGHAAVSRELKASGRMTVEQVANTIIPWSLYHRSAPDPAALLFENWGFARRVNCRRKRRSTTYFDRLTHYELREGVSINQLKHQLKRLRAELEKRGPYRGIYELGLTGEAELRLMVPGVDHVRRSFPCLSHVSLTLLDEQLHLMAQYRYQYMLSKALGNYLGLSRLLAFLANELRVSTGRVTVNAAYAKVETEELGDTKKWQELAKRLGSKNPQLWLDHESELDSAP